MIVNVQCYTGMKRFAPEGRENFDLEIETGGIVYQVLEQLGVPENIQPLITVNGDRATPDTRLSSGDKVILFTPSEGG